MIEENPIYKKTLREICVENHDILTMFFVGEDLNRALKTIIGYYHIDEVFNLQKGRFIRWISHSSARTKSVTTNQDNNSSYITNGAFIMDIKFLDTGTHILCKNKMNKIIQIKYDNCIIFQKMTFDENLIFNANNIINFIP
jgi:hypothetical protein